MEDTARLTLFESLVKSYAFLTVTHFVMQVRWVFGSVICWTLLAVHTRYPGFSLLPAGAETSPWVLMAFSKRNELLSSNLAYLACYLTCNNITCCFIICKDVKEIKVLAFSPTNMLNTFFTKVKFCFVCNLSHSDEIYSIMICVKWWNSFHHDLCMLN